MLISASHNATCGWCGCYHDGRCPLVKSIEFYKNGTIKRVEFYDASVFAALPPKVVIKIDGNGHISESTT